MLKKNYKVNYLIPLFIWLINLIMNLHFFRNKNPIVSYLYPYSPNNYFYLKLVILEIINLLLIINIIKAIRYIIVKIKNNDSYYSLFAECFIITFVIHLIYLLFYFPGQWSGDSLHLLEYAKSLRLIPWHNVYTSMFYIISYSFIPHPTGIVICQFIIISLILSYIYANIFKNKKTKIRFFYYLISLLPINFFYSNWVFRTTLSSYLELFFIFYFIFNKDNFKYKKIVFILIILLCFISIYRSENIVYILMLSTLFLNKKSNKIGIVFTFIAAMLFLNLPQKVVSNNYYYKDYLINTAYEPLQYMANSIPEEELKKYYTDNINNVIPYDYIKKYGYHSYFEYNYDMTGYGTTLNNTKEEQDKFIKDVLLMFTKYYKYYLADKINGATNLLFNKTYFPNDKLISERKTYYFEGESKILRNKFVTLYGDSVEQNPNLKYRLIIPLLIIIISLVKNICLKKSSFILYLILLLKCICIIILSPQTLFMYFYFIYLTSYYLLFYEIINYINKKTNASL